MRRLSSAPSRGELHAVVDAPVCTASAAGAHRPGDRRPRAIADHVGEVLLALGVVRGQPRERVAQHGGVEGVDAGVDLANRALGVGRVLVLDDREDPAVASRTTRP